ncbi:hypothetical protein GPA19_24785, partial [Azoarcus indigens]|nr:hypothetical protein [Azoarcus indigens]
YVHGPGVDEPLVWYEGTGTTNKTWLYADQLGSVVGAANSAGTSTAIYSYGPFGEPNVTTGVRFRYTGQQYLGGLNLYYYKARFYSPALGRFLQTDPIGTRDDLNPYAYVGNNPINRIDPLGLNAVEGSQLSGGVGGLPWGSSFTGERIEVAYCIPCIPPAVAAVGEAVTAAGGFGAGWWLGSKVNVIYNEGANSAGSKEPPVPGATLGDKTKGRTTQWEKGGGMDEANRDFDAKGPADVVPLPDGGRRGTLPDGRQINVRPDSTDGRPTLEIQNGKNRDKVRYDP